MHAVLFASYLHRKRTTSCFSCIVRPSYGSEKSVPSEYACSFCGGAVDKLFCQKHRQANVTDPATSAPVDLHRPSRLCINAHVVANLQTHLHRLSPKHNSSFVNAGDDVTVIVSILTAVLTLNCISILNTPFSISPESM